MEESQKRASTSPTLKEKASLLDGEIGKDFLSSWKSMSVTENDTMDFDFGTVAKGKKKTFNFDNLDVDFSLDGDFDKISSFKVDMSDIDISSPAKKSGKPRERTKEEAAGGNQGKQDRFSFPFDFNDLDSFSFEPSLMKEGKKCNKTQVSKVSLNGSESQGSGGPLTDDVGVLEDVVMSKLPASKCVTISNTRTIVDAHEDLDPMNENSLSKSVINENHTAKSTTSRNLIASQRARTWPQNTVTAVTQEHYQESHRPDQGISTEPYVCETIQPIQDLSVQSGSENESVHDTTSDINGEVCSLAPKVIPNSGGEQNNNVKAIAGLASESGNSPGNNCETNKFGSQNHVSGGNTDDSEAAQSDSHFEYNCSTSFSRESLKDMKTKGVNLNSTSKLLSAPLSSGTSVDKLRGTEEKVSGIIRSKFFNRSNETKSQAQHALLTQTKLTSFVSKGIGMQRPTDERREDTNAKDAQCGSKLSGSLRSYSGDGDKTEPLQPGSGRNVVALKINRGECMNADVAQSGSKGTGYSRPQEIKVSKAEPVLQGSGNSNNELHTFSSTEQMNKYVPQNSVNPRLTGSSMASAKNMNNISVEGNKISPLTFGRGKTDLSSLKISRTNGPNEGPSKSTFLGDIKSGRSTEQKRELHGNTASKLAHSLGTEMKTPPTPSLKRKTFEASNVDMLTIKPAKRLSESPTESRIREPSERVGDEKTPTLHFPREMNMTEPDTHLVMENDGSIERAEACTKELEDICNMLKKKHEEAKEILVRAIVNNNTLLILNHPICEEKIRMVQKFAAQLMSKELRT